MLTKRSIWLHATVLDIFRPFISTNKRHGFRSWSVPSRLTEAIFAASVQQLKHLLLVYMTEQPSATYSIFWNAAALYVANAVLNDATDPERRFYFMLSVRAYQNMYPCFRVAEGIIQGLLAIAVGNGSIGSAEAHALIQELGGQRGGGKGPNLGVGSYVLDFELAAVDHDAVLVNSLVDKFEEISTFSTFTKGIVLNVSVRVATRCLWNS